MEALTFSEMVFPGVPNVRAWMESHPEVCDFSKRGQYGVFHAGTNWLVVRWSQAMTGSQPCMRDLLGAAFKAQEVDQGVIGYEVAGG